MAGSCLAVVVGAGPAGATAARELAFAGLGPVRLLERARVPRVKPCAGGLSANAQGLLRQLGLLRQVEREAYPIRGAVIGAPSGRELLLEGDAASLVLDRARLDQLLVEAAVESGAELTEGVRVRQVRPAAGGGFEVEADRGRRWHSRWVVVATGAAGHLGGQRLPASRLVTMTGWYRGARFWPHTLEMYFDAELAPHYGWLFPEAPDRVNIGLCVDHRRTGGRSPRKLMARFVNRHFAQRLEGAEPIRPWRGFPIAAAATPAPVRTPPGVLVAGEAAHLAHRATGEGISLALRSGLLAAEVICQATRQGRSPEAATAQYQRWLRWRLGPSLWLSHRFAAAAPPVLDLLTLAGRSALVRRVLAHTLSRL